jgi:nitroreductase
LIQSADMGMGFDVVLRRQSPLALREPGPDGTALRTMLDAAVCAPDHGKLKPWRFIVIAGAVRHAFGAVLAEALRQREPGASDALLAREQAKALRAPMILVVIAKVRERKLVPAVEQIIAAGIAANNILVAAHGLGYGGMWRTGAAAYDEHVRQALGIDTPDSIVGFLYLGTPETMPPARDLAALEPEVRYWHEALQVAAPRTQ